MDVGSRFTGQAVGVCIVVCEPTEEAEASPSVLDVGSRFTGQGMPFEVCWECGFVWVESCGADTEHHRQVGVWSLWAVTQWAEVCVRSLWAVTQWAEVCVRSLWAAPQWVELCVVFVGSDTVG